MMAGQKKTAPEKATSGAETRKFIENSISDMPCNVKRCTAVHQLNSTERGYIRAVYRYAKTKNQLMTELKKLTFCEVQTALNLLVAMEYITKSDADFLLGESEKM